MASKIRRAWEAWRGAAHNAPQHKVQAALLLPLTLLFLGIPLTWNWAIAKRSAQRTYARAANASGESAMLGWAVERRVVETLVNERRLARGLAPVSYEASASNHPDVLAAYDRAMAAQPGGRAPPPPPGFGRGGEAESDVEEECCNT